MDSINMVDRTQSGIIAGRLNGNKCQIMSCYIQAAQVHFALHERTARAVKGSQLGKRAQIVGINHDTYSHTRLTLVAGCQLERQRLVLERLDVRQCHPLVETLKDYMRTVVVLGRSARIHRIEVRQVLQREIQERIGLSGRINRELVVKRLNEYGGVRLGVELVSQRQRSATRNTQRDRE